MLNPQYGGLGTTLLLALYPLTCVAWMVLPGAYAPASIVLHVIGTRKHPLLDKTVVLEKECRCSGLGITLRFAEFDKTTIHCYSSVHLTVSVTSFGISPRNPRISMTCHEVSSLVSYLSRILIDPIDHKLLIDCDRSRFASPKIERPSPFPLLIN
jgi:hypothetical protein